ncbi:MAG: single-stranded DNA-binding protein [Clostridia bacterium]|nr:single-stranded DNA-binding protein [Clostridia bacterium]MBR2883275.1 single-stranded DNA-binding protein [Clostridia bacterium]
MENNVITLVGTVETEAEYSHSVLEEEFFSFMLRVPRLSENDDLLPVTVSARQLDTSLIKMGNKIKVKGQLRSYNKYTQTKTRLILTVFAKGIASALPEDEDNPNEIFINGFICKTPVYRRTPFGREITDLIIAVNRAFNRSDYIPAIAWGKNAVYSENLEVGSNVMLWGRLQSRNYNKRISEEETEVRTAYELSITKIEKLA